MIVQQYNADFIVKTTQKSWQNTFREDKLWLDSLSTLLAFPMGVYPSVVACETLLTIFSLPSGKGKDLKSNGVSSRADFCLQLIGFQVKQNAEILKDHCKQGQKPVAPFRVFQSAQVPPCFKKPCPSVASSTASRSDTFSVNIREVPFQLDFVLKSNLVQSMPIVTININPVKGSIQSSEENANSIAT